MKPYSLASWTAVCVSVLGLAPQSIAQSDMARTETRAAETSTRLFNLAALDPAKILPPPPAPGSLEAEADIQAVLQAQAWRTPEQVDWAQRVDQADFFALFGAEDLLGSEFTSANFPRFAALFRSIANESRLVNEAAKKLFSRPRPFVGDPRVQPCIERPTGNSYPSGHAQAARLRARVLAEIFPEKRAALLERADRFAWGRVLGGAHYPSDLVAGNMLADAIMAQLQQSAAFQRELEACRAEAESVRRKKAA